ncbi:hypothetical protein [Bosea sp. 2RAB26]|uniref:hypothetical protein n=1 Tax=Bosea sp. 2RAB26 TaxID=3237476 RepID=UPI003F8FA5FB
MGGFAIVSQTQRLNYVTAAAPSHKSAVTMVDLLDEAAARRSIRTGSMRAHALRQAEHWLQQAARSLRVADEAGDVADVERLARRVSEKRRREIKG